MVKPDPEKSSRRDFLTGISGQKEIRKFGDKIADRLTEEDESPEIPVAGQMVRLSVNAMACEFAISMNPGSNQQVSIASEALEKLEPLEQIMTTYRDSSELSRVNQTAYDKKQKLNSQLFDVLSLSQKISEETEGAYDPTMGPLITLWKQCRDEKRLPNDKEISNKLSQIGIQKVLLDRERKEIQLLDKNVTLDLGGIGKGFAIDEIIPTMIESSLNDFLFHGGHSSVYANGTHNNTEGWPVGIRNPLLTEESLATIVLKNQAMSTSGSNAQYYRFEGKRYGHILNPKSGCPADNLLSAVVVSPSAAEADALSTAFYVMEIEDSVEYCLNNPHVGAILIAQPVSGRKLEPIVVGIPDSQLFYHNPERDLVRYDKS